MGRGSLLRDPERLAGRDSSSEGASLTSADLDRLAVGRGVLWIDGACIGPRSALHDIGGRLLGNIDRRDSIIPCPSEVEVSPGPDRATPSDEVGPLATSDFVTPGTRAELVELCPSADHVTPGVGLNLVGPASTQDRVVPLVAKQAVRAPT